MPPTLCVDLFTIQLTVGCVHSSKNSVARSGFVCRMKYLEPLPPVEELMLLCVFSAAFNQGKFGGCHWETVLTQHTPKNHQTFQHNVVPEAMFVGLSTRLFRSNPTNSTNHHTSHPDGCRLWVCSHQSHTHMQQREALPKTGSRDRLHPDACFGSADALR